jgi:hypothetical protein
MLRGPDRREAARHIRRSRPPPGTCPQGTQHAARSSTATQSTGPRPSRPKASHNDRSCAAGVYCPPSANQRRTAAMRAPGVGDWVMPYDCAFGEVGRADRLERGRSLPPGRFGGYLRRHGELSCTGHRRQHGHWQGDRAPARCRRLRPLYIAERSSSLEGCGALAAACVSCTAPRPARPGLRNCAAR